MLCLFNWSLNDTGKMTLTVCHKQLDKLFQGVSKHQEKQESYIRDKLQVFNELKKKDTPIVKIFVQVNRQT